MSTLYTFISRYGRKKPLLAGRYQRAQYNACNRFLLNSIFPNFVYIYVDIYKINPNISNQNKIPNVEKVVLVQIFIYTMFLMSKIGHFNNHKLLVILIAY